MRTGSWSIGLGAMTNTVDTTNFVINADAELVLKQHGGSTAVKKWDNTPALTTTFKWTSKAYDFGSPTIKKKLYQVVINATSGANVQVKVAYDNATSTTNVFTSNTLSDNAYITRNELVVSSPTAFTYLTLEISSNGTTAADFAISDMSFIFRPLGAR